MKRRDWIYLGVTFGCNLLPPLASFYPFLAAQ
jgi:hypothetical protein